MMPDRKKVIKGLECHVNGHPHTRCHKCPYWGTGPHGASECNDLAAGALALLKAQEPVKPLKMEVEHVRKEPVVFSYQCPVCMCGLQRHWVACPICGTGVKWE